MANTTVDVATGKKIVFVTSGWTAEFTEISRSGAGARSVIETTHLGSSTRSYIPGDCPDSGTLNLAVNWNPEVQPPYTNSTEVIRVFYPTNGIYTTTTTNGTDHVVYEAFNGFVTGWDDTGVYEEKMTARVTVKLTGAMTKVNAGA